MASEPHNERAQPDNFSHLKCERINNKQKRNQWLSRNQTGKNFFSLIVIAMLHPIAIIVQSALRMLFLLSFWFNYKTKSNPFVLPDFSLIRQPKRCERKNKTQNREIINILQL